MTEPVAVESPRVVVVGSINVDLFARVARHPAPGETVLGGDGSTRPGGKGANQAVAAALAGASTVMVGCVGDDGPAEVGLSLLRRAEVDISRVRIVEGVPTGVAIITVAESGENSIIVIPGANHLATRADVESADLRATDIVVVQGELPVEVVDETVRIASEAGARVVVNLAPVVDLSADTLRAANPLVVNEHEALAAARILGVDSPDEQMTVESASALASALCGEAASVVITLGGAGAVVAERGQDPIVCQGERVDVVDTTGAGDCFVGTLTAGLARGDSLAESAAAGNLAGARAVQGEGAQESYGWKERS